MIGADDLLATVLDFATPHTRRRYGPSSTTASHLQLPGVAEDDEILAFFHDAPAEVVQQLPEGHEGGRIVQGYTPADVRVASSTTRADVVLIGGVQFEVVSVARWASGPTATVTWSVVVAVQVERP